MKKEEKEGRNLFVFMFEYMHMCGREEARRGCWISSVTFQLFLFEKGFSLNLGLISARVEAAIK